LYQRSCCSTSRPAIIVFEALQQGRKHWQYLRLKSLWHRPYVITNSSVGPFIRVTGLKPSPTPPKALIAINREKPYLSTDSNGNYVVVMPGLQTNSVGTTLASGPIPAVPVSIDQFYLKNSTSRNL
jgi:hypothetical protein